MTASFPIKRLFDVRRDTVEPSSFGNREVFHYSLPVWHEIGDGRIESANELASLKLLLSGGEILVSKLNPDKGAVVYCQPHTLPVIASTEFIALRPRLVDGRFGYWLMNSASIRAQLSSSVESVTNSHKRARVDRFLASRVHVPDLPTQKAVAGFLDRETVRIDQLIEKKQRLVKVLGEKVAASISYAVRGLLTSPDAPRRADIDWLDSYPEHWARLPLKFLGHGNGAVFIDGDWIESKDLANSGIRYLTTGNVGQGYYKEQGFGFISQETFVNLKCTEVMPGDILVSRLNLPIGRACIVPDIGTRIVTSVDNVIVRPRDDVDRQFLVHLLTSREHFENTANIARGTTMQRISRSALGDIRIPMPPLAEQRSISLRLKQATDTHRLASEAIEHSIDRLREFRAALITAAITGRIDVATWHKHSSIDRRLDAIQEEMAS